jgi:putative salt-induced outer membrane protein YdiY
MRITPMPMQREVSLVLSSIAALTWSVSLGAADAAAPAAAPKEPPKWERSASLGVTVTSGNTDTLLFTGNVVGTRKWDQNELALGADFTYGEVDSKKNTDSQHGFAQYNRLFTERWYGYGRVDALRDAVADVDYRFTLGPGIGYYFIKNEKTLLRLEGGPSYILEKVGGREDDYLALRIGERFEHKFSATTRIWQSFEFLPQVDDFKNFIMVGEIGVGAALTKTLELRAIIQDTYDNVPAANRKKNDVKLVSAVAYKF